MVGSIFSGDLLAMLRAMARSQGRSLDRLAAISQARMRRSLNSLEMAMSASGVVFQRVVQMDGGTYETICRSQPWRGPMFSGGFSVMASRRRDLSKGSGGRVTSREAGLERFSFRIPPASGGVNLRRAA